MTLKLWACNMAEEEGFEPSVQVSSHGHLANDWFKPLTHSSI